MIHSDDIIRMLVEITTGKEPSPPDTPEFAAKRAILQKECDEIRAKGHEVEIPFEISDIAKGKS